jgi:hypothetical protein
MAEPGTLVRCEAALRFIEQIPDLVTRALVNMAFVRLVKRVHLDKQAFPASDLDMLFLVRALGGFFGEHGVLARALRGERVGAWEDDAV